MVALVQAAQAPQRIGGRLVVQRRHHGVARVGRHGHQPAVGQPLRSLFDQAWLRIRGM
ncbi:Uncharacterised protein [Bordetella pertussis]|nr:Uncharacterised protein [Bordetella pertussis]